MATFLSLWTDLAVRLCEKSEQGVLYFPAFAGRKVYPRLAFCG